MTSTVPNPGLTAPDELAGDIQFPTLDESLFNTEPMDVDLGLKDDDPLNWSTQMQSDPLSIEVGRGAPEEQPTFYEDDLPGLDFGEVENPRDAPPPRSVADDLIESPPKMFDDDLGLALDDDAPLPARDSPEYGEMPVPDDNFGMDIDPVEPTHDPHGTQAPVVTGNDPRLEHVSQSPLSSVRSSEVREFNDSTTFDEPPQVARRPAAKKRKILPTDTETTLSASLIKQQQNDRSAILKPVSLLPKDPLLLALMTMQQNGGFVSSIMGDDRTKGLAPQLQGLLSFDAIRKAGSHKRKRDSGVADLGQDGDLQNADIPQIEIPEDDDMVQPDEGVADLSKDEPSTILHIPGQSELDPPVDENAQVNQEEDDDLSPVGGGFDDTTMPLLNPEEQGPISVGTQHAVHVLRDYFGGSAEAASSKKGALFQDLYPEKRTSKAEATKMFFETLVLATKDAIKVEQPSSELGAAIRIRPKRNLWGEWAEREAGGEIANNENNATAA